MVDTIKFSQMTDGGNLANDDKTPGLQGGANVLFNNPWTFLPPGTTAQRPTPSAAVNFRLRFNTEDQLYEYYDAVLGQWTQLQESAFTQGPFITYTASASLPDAQNLALLADGILTQTISAGIATLDILAIPLTGAFGGTGVNNGASTITIGGNFQMVGAFTFAGTLTGDTAVTFPTSGTLITSTDASGHVSAGTINELAWYAATGDTVSGLPTANGGTLVTDNTGVPSILAGSGVTGNYLQSVNLGTPIWSLIKWPDTLALYDFMYCGSTNVVNVLTAQGSSVMSSTQTGAPVWVGPLADGQIVIGSTGLVPVAANITQGSGVTITNGPGSITISATGTGGTVTEVDTGAGLTGGPITTTGTIALAAIADHTLLANISGGALAPSSTTLTALIDNAIGNVQGDILYRNATVWTVLAPGTAGFSLQTGGAGADPSYSNTFTNSTLVTPATLGVQQQALNMNSHLINNVTDPVSAQDAATKNYVDQTALTGTSVYAASAASLGTVTQSGSGVGATLTNAGTQATFALDGVNPPVGSSVLIKNTATGMTAANEGIYEVVNAGSGSTNWVLRRDVDYDTPEQINETGLIVVRNGSTLAGTGWYNTTTIVTVDTTNFNFAQFGSGGTVTSIATANGITGGTITTTGTIQLASMFNINASAPANSMTMDANGVSQFANNISFYAQLGSAVTNVTGDGTVYTLIFTNENYDIGGGYNPATGVFTAPVAGKYLFRWGAGINPLASGHTSGDGLYLNTSSEGNEYTTIGNYFAMSQAGSLYLYSAAIATMTAGATASIKVMIAGGAKTVGIGDTGASQFRGMLIA